FFFSSRRRHTRFSRDWSSDVCSSDLKGPSHPHRFHARGKKECAICSRLVLEYDCPGAGHRAVVGRPTRVVVRERLAFQPDATGAEARSLRPARALAWLCLRPGAVPPLSAGRLLHLPLAV